MYLSMFYNQGDIFAVLYVKINADGKILWLLVS